MNSKGNMKQTALEWLMDKMCINNILSKEDIEYFEQAKAMEKEQIMDAYNQGCNDYDELGHKRIEHYYNETFKTE